MEKWRDGKRRDITSAGERASQDGEAITGFVYRHDRLCDTRIFARSTT